MGFMIIALSETRTNESTIKIKSKLKFYIEK
jgi:hypothetical protein